MTEMMWKSEIIALSGGHQMRKALVLSILALAGCTGSTPNNQGQDAANTDVTSPEAIQAVAEIDPNVRDPYTRDQFPRTFATWGDSGVRRIDKLRVAAAETVAKNRRCDRVELSELSDNRSSPPDSPIVFVDCANGERFYLGEADVDSAVASQSEKSNRFSRGELTRACTEAVKARLNFPSTMDKKYWSVGSYQAPTTGNWVISFDFTAKNAFGIDLPASAKCYTTPEGKTEIEILSR